MLGKLARWLVILGFDARWAGNTSKADLELLEEARREGRVFVTRDRGIPEVQGLPMVVLREGAVEAQLSRLLRDLGLRADLKLLFTRCTYCNAALELLEREEALPLVPELVRSLDTPFWRCPSCRRLYWNGTHVERTIKKIKRLGL